MADDSLITQEQYNADIKRLYDEKIYPYLNGATHVGCVPVGSRLDGWFTTTPKYYLYCDGAEYLKSDYPELAELLAQIDEVNSTTQYVGSDANHFKVPDLRGEFIRGTGTNGHTGEGNGANVGVHQNGTNHVQIAINSSGNTMYSGRLNGVNTQAQNIDYSAASQNLRYLSPTGSATTTATSAPFYKARPTNTSLPQYICYKTHYIDLALDSFPLDITQPTDGQLLMYDATAGRWVNGGHKYSTDEHVVGTWIDSKPIYERTIELGAISTWTKDADYSYKKYLNNLDIDTPIHIQIYYKWLLNSKDYLFVQESPAYVSNNNAFGGSYSQTIMFIKYDSNVYLTLNIGSVALSRYNGGYAIIQYTKTTDTPSS